MALNPYAIMHVVLSHLKAQGKLTHVRIGLPKQPPTGELTVAIVMDGIRTPELVLDARVLVYDLMVHVFRSFLDDGAQTELEVARVVGEITEAFAGDFTLGGNVRNIDFAGQYGRSVEVNWDYLAFGDVQFRAVAISLPLIVDPAAELVA